MLKPIFFMQQEENIAVINDTARLQVRQCAEVTTKQKGNIEAVVDEYCGGRGDCGVKGDSLVPTAAVMVVDTGGGARGGRGGGSGVFLK